MRAREAARPAEEARRRQAEEAERARQLAERLLREEAEKERLRKEAQRQKHEAEERRRQEYERARRDEEDRRRRTGQRIEDIQKMSGPAFEEMVAGLFRRDGYQVSRRGGAGDEGIDLMLHFEHSTDVVQCKRWRNEITPTVVRDFYGSLRHVDARHGFIITTATFTKAASTWAADKPITLIDGAYLVGWANGARSSRAGHERVGQERKKKDPYEVLGVSRHATKEEIRARYKALMLMYHPDKVASLAPEYQAIAHDKTQEITDAYDRLKKRS